MEPWLEYANTVQRWDDHVAANPCAETYLERWQARINHPSWQQKREFLIWACHGRCERCGINPNTRELQLHHLHYDTLWYESHKDLQLLCPPCHYKADEERAEEQALRNTHLSIPARAHRYMEIANRWSGQPDWPVSYKEALRKVLHIHALDD